MARALVIAAGGPIAAGVVRGLIEAGVEVAEIWGGLGSYKSTRRFAPAWNVAELARTHRIPRFKNPPLRSWDGAERRIGEIGADLLVTAMTMQIVPAPLLDLFGGRAVNVHPALLPAYRGPTPVLGMMLDGREDVCGGVTLHQLSPAIDEGPVIAQRAVPRNGRAYQVWRGYLAREARNLARMDLPRFLAGEIEPTPQVGGSYSNVSALLTLGGATTLSEARVRTDRVGATGRLKAGNVRIKALAKVLGEPSGEAAAITWRSVTLDLADARVSFLRFQGLDDLGASWDTVSTLRAIDRQE